MNSPFCYEIKFEITEGTALIEIEITPNGSAHLVYSWFKLNNVKIGEFDGILLNRVATKNWRQPLGNSFQCKSFLNFLKRRSDEDLKNLSRLRVLVLLNMKIKEEFLGKNLGARMLEKLITQQSPDFRWDSALGWARSKNENTGKNLNQAAAKIFKHYEKHLPNCVRWNEKSTFFLSSPGNFQAKNVNGYLNELVQQNRCENLSAA